MEIKNAVCVRCFNEVVSRGLKLQRERKGTATKLEILMEMKKSGIIDCYVCKSIQKCMVCQMVDNTDKIKEKLFAST